MMSRPTLALSGLSVALLGMGASTAALATPVAGPAAAKAVEVGQAVPQGVGFGGTFLMLGLVIALILAMAWVLKKLPGAGLKPLAGLRVVASLAVGPRERVVLVDCGGQQLLLGVTQHNVNLLHTLAEPILDAPSQAGFAELLAKLKSRDSV